MLWRYGWPGIAAEIHFSGVCMPSTRRYGWPGIAAEIHWSGVARRFAAAMVGRESLLRYTTRRWAPGEGCAMVGRESLLRYTGKDLGISRNGLWLAGNRC